MSHQRSLDKEAGEFLFLRLQKEVLKLGNFPQQMMRGSA